MRKFNNFKNNKQHKQRPIINHNNKNKTKQKLNPDKGFTRSKWIRTHVSLCPNKLEIQKVNNWIQELILIIETTDRPLNKKLLRNMCETIKLLLMIIEKSQNNANDQLTSNQTEVQSKQIDDESLLDYE